MRSTQTDRVNLNIFRVALYIETAENSDTL